MLANFLNKSKPINFIGLMIFFVIGCISTLISTFLNGDFSTIKLLKCVLLLIMFVFVFLIYNFIVTKNKLTHDNSFAFFFFTVLIYMILPELISIHILILMLVYLLFLRKIYSLRSPNKVLEKLFDSGFWLGVFFVLEPQSVLLILLIYVAIYLHHKITIHTILVPIVGFLSPLLLYFTYFFWTDNIEVFTNLFYIEMNFNIQFYRETKFFWFVISLLVFSFLAIVFKSIKAFSINNTFRRSWIVLIINFIILFIFLLFFNSKNGSEIIFLLFPTSIIIANGIELINKKTVKNLIIYLFIASCILFRYFL